MAPINIGDTLPAIELFEDLPSNKVNICELTAKKVVVLFGVPGAFTPVCSKTHLPGYLAKVDHFKEDGVDEIICVSVNDPYVMAAWGEQYSTKGKIRMLADPAGDFIKALSVDVDIPALGGIRSKRFSMVTYDGKVEVLNIEPDSIGLTCTLADQLCVRQYSCKFS